MIYSEKGHWGFRKWDYAPGPGPDDIDFQTETLEQAVYALLNYYLGKPMILNKWIIPIHKHPEWDAERLIAVVKSGISITLDEWETIHSEYVNKRIKLRSYPLAEIFACLFNPIAHSEDSSLILYLRRDLNAAYIVRSSHERSLHELRY